MRLSTGAVAIGTDLKAGGACSYAQRYGRNRSSRLFGLERQRCRVEAVAQAGRRRPILEDMAEMGFAAAAQDFGAGHEEAAVGFGCHALGADRRREARPARARIEFRAGIEQFLAAADAGVDARG